MTWMPVTLPPRLRHLLHQQGFNSFFIFLHHHLWKRMTLPVLVARWRTRLLRPLCNLHFQKVRANKHSEREDYKEPIYLRTVSAVTQSDQYLLDNDKLSISSNLYFLFISL